MQYSVIFTRDVCTKFDIHNLPQSPDIGQISDGGNSNFRISGLSLIKRNCHNSRTSDDIDKRLGPVTKLNKRNKATSKKRKKNWWWSHVGNCNFIANYSSYSQFGAIRKPDSGCIVYKSYIFFNSDLLSYNNYY